MIQGTGCAGLPPIKQRELCQNVCLRHGLFINRIIILAKPDQPVRKAIRFGRLHGRRVDWPSDVKPEIIQGGDTIFVLLRFEGQNCRSWTKRQRALYEYIAVPFAMQVSTA